MRKKVSLKYAVEKNAGFVFASLSPFLKVKRWLP